MLLAFNLKHILITYQRKSQKVFLGPDLKQEHEHLGALRVPLLTNAHTCASSPTHTAGGMRAPPVRPSSTLHILIYPLQVLIKVQGNVPGPLHFPPTEDAAGTVTYSKLYSQ